MPIWLTSASLIPSDLNQRLTADLPPRVFLGGDGLGFTSVRVFTTCERTFSSWTTRSSRWFVSSSECLTWSDGIMRKDQYYYSAEVSSTHQKLGLTKFGSPFGFVVGFLARHWVTSRGVVEMRIRAHCGCWRWHVCTGWCGCSACVLSVSSRLGCGRLIVLIWFNHQFIRKTTGTTIVVFIQRRVIIWYVLLLLGFGAWPKRGVTNFAVWICIRTLQHLCKPPRPLTWLCWFDLLDRCCKTKGTN